VEYLPLELEKTLSSQAEIKMREDIRVLKVVVIEPISKTATEYDFFNFKAGEMLRVPIPKPYAVLPMATLSNNGICWEGFAKIVYPVELKLEVIHPMKVKYPEEIEIKIRTNTRRRIPAWVVVRDYRLRPLNPAMHLAYAIQKGMNSFLFVTHGFQSLHHLIKGETLREPLGIGLPYYEVFVIESPPPPLPQQKIEGQKPKVLYSRIINLENGEASLKIGAKPGTYTINVFALDGLDWQNASSSFIVTN
jgi:hypothetical protein